MANDSDVGRDRVDDHATSADPWARLRNESTAEGVANAWLDLQIGMIGADVRHGVVVMGASGGGAFAPVAVWPAGTLGSPALVAAIESAITKSAPVTIGARRVAVAKGGKQTVDAIACPLLVDGKVCGAVALETEHRPQIRQQEMIAQLGWGAAWLESHIQRNKYILAERLVAVIELTATALHHERFQAAATAVATELAGTLSCDRVSIGFLHGKNSRIAVLSHSAAFGKKANVIRAIEATMDEAIDQQATITWPRKEGGPLQVTRAHERLGTEHGAETICTVPLAQGDKMLGAITLERPQDLPFDSAAVEVAEHVAALLGPLLDVKRRDDRLLVSKAMDSARALIKKLFGPRHTALKLIASSVLLVALFFIFAKGEYRVTVDANLEGSIQRAITTPVAGYIATARVRAGDTVKAGDVMFALDDRELTLERLKWTSQRAQYSREYAAAVAGHDRAQANISSAQVEQADAQIALVEEQLRRMKGLAPFDSFVVSGDLSQSLGAPVERGDVLFQVAPLDAYRVVLKVEERDIGDIRVGQSGTLVLTGMPGEKLEIQVEKVTPVSIAEEGVNYFRVEASLSGDSSAVLRPGMEGVGKVHVEERRLIWIWTYKITHWLRMFFWSWWP